MQIGSGQNLLTLSVRGTNWFDGDRLPIVGNEEGCNIVEKMKGTERILIMWRWKFNLKER